jgi:hypothetical protein
MRYIINFMVVVLPVQGGLSYYQDLIKGDQNLAILAKKHNIDHVSWRG